MSFDAAGLPIAPPPAAPPPPPPPSDSDAGSVRSVTLEDDDDYIYGDKNTYTEQSSGQSSSSSYFGSSYQMGGSAAVKVSSPSSSSVGSNSSESTASSSSSNRRKKPLLRPAVIPVVTNYGVSPVVKEPKKFTQGTEFNNNHQYHNHNNNNIHSSSMLRGDPNIKPNTGETNDDFGGIGSLREVVGRLRWFTITTLIFAIIWEGFAFPGRLIIHFVDKPAMAVLGGYLGIFCLLLLGVELNAPLRDNFGILYHPLGRGALLFLMSGMCFGILAAWWEILLGIAFIVCAAGYVYCYIKYPEYRRWQNYNDNQIWNDVRSAVGRGGGGGGNTYSWARPNMEEAAATAGWHAVQRETQSLLHTV